ncbi:MAG TPA: flavin reductase family protein [Longimicrobium sp.]|nr:flavin reductase family protein [Longimicrobium sp.]
MAKPIQPTIRTHADAPDAENPVGRAEFREAAAFWATGVGVLAAADGDHVEAITVAAFTPLSADPPLVLVCVGNDAAVLYVLEDAGRFTISLLAKEDRRAASDFAQRLPPAPGRFAPGVDPVLRGALVSFVCTLRETHPGGDHRIVVGQVERIVMGDGDPDPLLYFQREYRRLG